LILTVGLVITVASIVASATRLKFVLVPTGWDPSAVDACVSRIASGGDRGKAKVLAHLEGAAACAPNADWERGLFAALRARPSARTALVNEQLTELDYRIKRWARVPRVCASICTSSGFLLAAIVLRATLADAGDAMDGGRVVDAAVFRAIDVAAVGLAGAAFCIAAQMRARSAAISRAEAYDRLVQRLERVSLLPLPTTEAGELPEARTA
jgi:hypothetical protein